MTPNLFRSNAQTPKPLLGRKEEERKGGAVLPPAFPKASPGGATASSSFLNARGVQPPSGSLWERLLRLKGSELAFVLAGAGALTLAPVAEYLVSRAPDESSLEAGFDSGAAPFEDAETYEDGVRRMSAGGLPGQHGRVIKPLDAPNPLSMITGVPEDAKTGAETPGIEGEPVNKRRRAKKTNWKEALSSAAAQGASKAGRAASLPKPSAKLSGALKGLSALSSGGGASSGAALAAPKLEAPSSKGLTGTPERISTLSRVTATPDFRGEASRGVSMAGGPEPARSSFDGRPGSAAGAGEFLLPTSRPAAGGALASSGGGIPSMDGASGDKGPGVSASQDQRQMGESLAFQQKKMEMQKAVDLKWAKKQYNELDKRKMQDQINAQTQSQLALKAVDIAGQLANTALQAALQGGQGQGGGGGGAGGGGAGGGNSIGGNMGDISGQLNNAFNTGFQAGRTSAQATETGNTATTEGENLESEENTSASAEQSRQSDSTTGNEGQGGGT